MRSQRAQMREVTPKVETIFQNITNIYLSPYHYTYVFQKQDRRIYLYDEMTMEEVGHTIEPVPDTFRALTFTDNFNCFIAYTDRPSPSLLLFQLNPNGIIAVRSCPLHRLPRHVTIFSISFIEKEKRVVAVDTNRIYFTTFEGQLYKQVELRHENHILRLIKGFCVKQQQWVLIEKDKLYFATIRDEGYAIDDVIPLKEPIWNLTLDAGLRNHFMAFITQQNTVVLLAREKEKWHYCHRFRSPNIILKKLCFLYPGAGTSTTNRFRDKVFLLMMGEIRHEHSGGHKKQPSSMEDEHEQGMERIYIPDNYKKDNAIFVQEYSITELLSRKKVTAKASFSLKLDHHLSITTVWANEHSQNSVRIFFSDKTVRNLDLTALLQGDYVGKEWVNLGFRFQPRTTNSQYEEPEEVFEKEKQEMRTIKEEDLNDWSCSLFPKEVMLKKTIRRLNCLNWD